MCGKFAACRTYCLERHGLPSSFRAIDASCSEQSPTLRSCTFGSVDSHQQPPPPSFFQGDHCRGVFSRRRRPRSCCPTSKLFRQAAWTTCGMMAFWLIAIQFCEVCVAAPCWNRPSIDNFHQVRSRFQSHTATPITLPKEMSWYFFVHSRIGRNTWRGHHLGRSAPWHITKRQSE